MLRREKVRKKWTCERSSLPTSGTMGKYKSGGAENAAGGVRSSITLCRHEEDSENKWRPLTIL